MINPGSLAGQMPAGDDALIRRIQELERAVKELSAQDVLRTAGLIASANKLTVQGELDITGNEVVSGSLSTSGATSIGGTLGVTGTTTLGAATTISGNTTVSGSLDVTGPMTVGGTLSLPAGIINNDALANPIVFGSAWNTASGFALPNAWTEYTACSITVPAGYTRIQFDAIGTLFAGNSLTSTQYLMTRITRQINGTGTVFNGVTNQTTLPAGFYGSAMTAYKWDETVAPGDVHRFAVIGWVGGGTWAANSSNYARLEVSASFTR